ncbi:MAG: MurR/RpiR family transcriptional regulator [Pseudomonadota bacterium]
MLGETAQDQRQSGQSLEGRIHAAYGQMPAAERKMADLILDFPGDVAAYSATELSELAGVSKAAATRFFQRLGFASFEEARRQARDAQKWGSPLYLQSKDERASDLSAELGRYLDEEIQALTATFEGLDSRLVEQVTERIVSAKRLWLLGFRNSHYAAAYARWQLIQFRRNVFLLPTTGETMGEYLADMDGDDLVIAVGVRRRVKGLRKVLEQAAGRGAEILYLTDPTARRSTELATWTITCQVSGGYLFDSYAAPFSVLRFLAIEAFRKSGKAGREHLETIERHHEELKEFE